MESAFHDYHRGRSCRWSVVGGRLVLDDDGGASSPDLDTARPEMPYERRRHPIYGVPWAFDVPPDSRKVAHGIDQLAAIAAIGVRSPGNYQRLEQAERVLRWLTRYELDAAIGSMDPRILEAIDRMLDPANHHDGFDHCRRQAFYNYILDNVSPYAVSVVGASMPGSQPDVVPFFCDVEGCARCEEGWVVPAGPCFVWDGAYYADQGVAVEASAAPVAWQDVRQGHFGNCWFLTSVQAVARANPRWLPDHLRRNANGTFSMMFYHSQTHRPCPVTVAPDLPVRNGRLIGASGHVRDPACAELWPAYVEKAFAQWYGGYASTEGGTARVGLAVLTGRPTEMLDHRAPDLVHRIAGRIAHGNAVCVGTRGASDRETILDGRLVGSHEYFVKAADPYRGWILLGNPWGDAATKAEWEAYVTAAEAAVHLSGVHSSTPW